MKHLQNIVSKIIYALIGAYLFTSCAILERATRDNCERRYGQCGEVQNNTVVLRSDTVIYRPGVRVVDTLRQEYFTRDSVFVLRVDTTGRNMLKILRDANGRLLAECLTRPDTLVLPGVKTEKTVEKIKTVEKEVEKVPFYFWLAFGIVVLALIVLALLFIRMRL